MPCAHSAFHGPIDAASLPNRSDYRVRYVEKPEHPQCAKACFHPQEGAIEVQKDFAERVSSNELAFAIAHEIAHAHTRKRCEPCADRLAGALMRKWGHTKRGVALGSAVVSTRNARDDALAGYEALR